MNLLIQVPTLNQVIYSLVCENLKAGRFEAIFEFLNIQLRLFTCVIYRRTSIHSGTCKFLNLPQIEKYQSVSLIITKIQLKLRKA